MDQAWKVHELRLAGHSYRAIGKLLGINHETVRNRSMEANRAIVLPGVEEMRKIEDERLDMLFKALMPKIQIGDTRAIEQALKLLERRARLHGLDKPIEINATVHEITEYDRELAEFAREAMMRREYARQDETARLDGSESPA